MLHFDPCPTKPAAAWSPKNNWTAPPESIGQRIREADKAARLEYIDALRRIIIGRLDADTTGEALYGTLQLLVMRGPGHRQTARPGHPPARPARRSGRPRQPSRSLTDGTTSTTARR